MTQHSRYQNPQPDLEIERSRCREQIRRGRKYLYPEECHNPRLTESGTRGDDFMIALVVSDLSYRVYLDFDTIDTVCLGLEIRRVPKQGSLVITYSTYDGLEVSETLSR